MTRTAPFCSRHTLLRGVSLTALLAAAPQAHAGGGFRSLTQALALQSNTALAAAAAGGGVVAARTASLGAQNLQKAAAALAHFRSLAEALGGGTSGAQVTDGISPGGLQPAAGAGSNPALWVGANLPTAARDPAQSGVTDVTVTQTKPVAALTWQNFSVGAHTKLVFDQSAGGTQKSSWLVINTLASASTSPSVILGEITAPGKVYVINRNGVVFGAGSVTDVGALAAATANIAQSQFGTDASGNLTFNLYGSVSGTTYTPTFTGGLPGAAVTVAPGASIETAPAGGTAEGGYVMLLGGQVSNAGVIGTPQGQTILAAGTDFTLRPGYSATGNAVSTTLGSEIAVSNGGTASNTGVIVADQGDITMVGHLVAQSGAILSTTTVNQRGTVHLLTDASDTTGQVVLGPGSLTEILPEDNGQTALDSQRQSNISLSQTYNAARISQTTRLNDTNALPDQHGESRIEISTGGSVEIANGALALAQGGQVAVAAPGSIVLDSGATVDVSGTNTALLPASVNALLVNIQPFQLRDSAGNRNGGLKSSNVTVDARQLVEIASGAYAGNVYTPGGLLEVSGYLGLIPHNILEWSAIGGQVILQGQSPNATPGGTPKSGAVVVQPGAVINLTGGLVTYQPGAIAQSYLIGPNGQLYNVNSAPGNLVYSGVYQGDVVSHPRWSVTQTYTNPLVTPPSLPSPGYVVGRDAGTLTIDAGTVALEGEVAAGVSSGQYQTGPRPANVTDPYLLAQTVVPVGGSLLIGNYIGGTLTATPFASSVTFGSFTQPVGSAGGTIPAALDGLVLVDAGQIGADALATLTVSTSGTLTVAEALSLADGGNATLSGHAVFDAASITARGGTITLTTLLPGQNASVTPGAGTIAVSSGVTLSTKGVWTNAARDPVHVAGEGLANGGSIGIDSTGGLTLAAGSTLDVSSGGAYLTGGKLLAARGGNVALTADIEPITGGVQTHFAPIDISARFLALGYSGGGTLAINVPEIRVGGSAGGALSDYLVVAPQLLQTGFADYTLNGLYGADVAPGADISVVEPVYAITSTAPLVPTGGDPAQAYAETLLPVYYRNGATDTFSQRPGASLALTANIDPTIGYGGGGTLTVGAGAQVTVDPGQSITLSAYGQITVYGTLTAHSGTISVLNTRGERTNYMGPANYAPGLSVWLDGTSVLDVSGRAVVFTDANGFTFGAAGQGGTIDLGAPAAIDPSSGLATYAEIVERPGAILDLAGSAAQVNFVPGAEAGGLILAPRPMTLAGNGGTLVARSVTGLALEGTIAAGGSGAGAAGGVISLRLDALPEAPSNLTGLPAGFYSRDQFIVSQTQEIIVSDPALLPGAVLPAASVGAAYFSQAQLAASGADELLLAAPVAITFDGAVALSAGRQIVLASPVIGETSNETSAQVSVTAPYVALAFGGGNDGNGTLPIVPSQAALTVSADLIDFIGGGQLGLFTQSKVSTGGSTTVTYTTNVIGFDHADFLSRGDIRFSDAAGQPTAGLETTANLTFSAAQLYPTTGASYTLFAGDTQHGGKTEPEFLGTITVTRSTPDAPVPYSVGGTLGFVGRDIVQDGVVRAPEGEIILGIGNLATFTRAAPVTEYVTLGPDSITSVSLDGATIPYGGTADGVTYNFAGSAAPLFNPLIVLQGQNIDVVGAGGGAPGASVDVSGGGTLAGSAFIFGRGGSVDVNKTPLISTASGKVSASTADSVFAIVPGYASPYAPASPGDAGYMTPGIGEQITVAAGQVPGLAAGTYTLLPAYYDLLPGAYRVELAPAPLPPGLAQSFGNFTTLAAVRIGTANTGVAASLASAALFTSSTGVRQLAQYDTETYSQFETAQAATFNAPRPLLPGDAKTLAINLDAVGTTPDPTGHPQTSSFAFAAGTLDQAVPAGGFGATVEVNSPMPVEIVPQAGDAGEPVIGPQGVPIPHATLAASELDALGLPRLILGGTLSSLGQGVEQLIAQTPEVLIVTGTELTAGDVMLTAAPGSGFTSALIDVAGGATISTIGQNTSAYSLADGYQFQPYFLGDYAVLDVSGKQNLFAPVPVKAASALISVESGATLLAGGSLDFVAPQGVSVRIGEARIGAQYVDLQVAAINIGSSAALAADAALLPSGFDLTSAVLASLLSGDPAAGVPAAQQLILSATQEVNILGGGTLALDTGSTGLVLNTPAIYGYGGAGDAVDITAKSFTWSGISTQNTIVNGGLTLTVSAAPGGQILDSAAHVLGALTINADQIVLGYGPLSQPNDQVNLERLLVGFGSVTLHGSQSITANNQSSLAVYATQTVTGQAGTGGSLTLDTPLLTTAAGARLGITTAGALLLTNSGSVTSNTGSVVALGGEIDLTAASATIDSTVALPSGRFSVTADGTQTSGGTITGAAIDLTGRAVIDLSGRATPIFDQTVSTPGGSLSLTSASGIVSSTTTTTTSGSGTSTVTNTATIYTTAANTDLSVGDDIAIAAGARIDVSAGRADRAAGGVSISALGGSVDIAGSILGTAGAGFMPGSFSLVAGSFGTATTFDTLNALLDAGHVDGARSFELAQGNILVDQTVTAHSVEIAADTGAIEVAGTIDAAGSGPGTIGLYGGTGLTIDGGAVLDAHATGDTRDSYGQNIDAENRAHITLSAAAGTLTIDPGATFDLRYSTANPTLVTAPVGQLVLDAPRSPGNDGVQASVAGAIDVLGAASIDLFAVRSYTPTDPNGTIVQHANGIAGEVTIDQIAADDTAFGASLAANAGGIAAQLAGLVAYGAGFNLEPGVQIVSGAASHGTLTISGDIDLSGLRISDPAGYGRAVSGTPGDGSGEPGSIAFRAAADLVVNGSVTDGFAAPGDQTRNIVLAGDNGWVYPLQGKNPTADALNADILLPTSTIGTGKSGTTTEIELAGSLNGGAATQFNTGRPISLNYDITVMAVATLPNVVIPFAAVVGTVSGTHPTIPAGGWIATAPIMRGGAVLYAKGALIPAGFTFQPGDTIGAGTILPFELPLADNTVVPAGTLLNIFAGNTLTLSQNTGVLPANAFIPAGTLAAFIGLFNGGQTAEQLTALAYRGQTTPTGTQGYLYPLAAMLPAGALSWSLDFTAGGNLAGANPDALLPAATLDAGGLVAANTINQAPGSLLIDDQHYATPSADGTRAVPAFSVIRTGTGDLSLQAGGSIDQSSLYGIYTAGSQDPLPYSGTGPNPNRQFDVQRTPYGPCVMDKCKLLPTTTPNNRRIDKIVEAYQAYYPTGGGDVRVTAQGNFTEDEIGQLSAANSFAGNLPSDLVGNWLWRQGTGTAVTGGASQPTAWWINFGTYVVPLDDQAAQVKLPPQLVGFQGIGTLGGGNLTVTVGGDAGQMTDRSGLPNLGSAQARGEGLILAVASTGRVLPGAAAPVLTGGGSLTLAVGGTINPLDEQAYGIGAAPGAPSGSNEVGINGDVIDVRGAVNVSAGAIGRIDSIYGTLNANDPRPLQPFAPQDGVQNGGITLVVGDASAALTTNRDLVLAGVADPGRVPLENLTADIKRKLRDGDSGFSLWGATTAVNLLAEGGNATPTTVPENPNAVAFSAIPNNLTPTDYRSVYPPTLMVAAPDGNITYGQAGALAFAGSGSAQDPTAVSLETAPAAFGQVSFLAGGSINANGYVVDISGADPALLSLPLDPAFTGTKGKKDVVTNVRGGIGTFQSPLALFAFQADTPVSDVHAADPQPARFYAASGDIINFQTGEILNFGSNDPVSQWYLAAKPVWIEAGGDIVSSGVRPAIPYGASAEQNLAPDTAYQSLGSALLPTTTGDLLLNTPGGISVVSAGQDILSSYIYVAGPGALEVSAGRNIFQGGLSADINGRPTQILSYGDIKSLGGVLQGAAPSLTGGASITLLAGTGAAGPDTMAFADLYFNPVNQANLGIPLSAPANKGKVQQTYADSLQAYLAQNYGYTGDAAGALAFFQANVPAAAQALFVRSVFFQELLASGRQYNDPASLFFHDYQRGRQAIDTLFPSADGGRGVPSGYSGTITMQSGTLSLAGTPVNFDAGVATLFGGNVQVLDPGGPVVLGSSSTFAGGNSGIVTYGSGDIDIFTLGSVLLGQSRIFTTAGGNIVIWSADGDINAGIGAKTTITFNPPLLAYDDTGGITVTPPASSSGAGIATLQSLPSVPAGNVDLIAPLGTIDAGEAGIRVSGNLNLAAARLVNTANISVKGSTTGAPTVSVASLGAVEAAGAAAGAAANAAQSQTQNRNNAAEQAASVIDVEVVSIGGSYEDEQKRKAKKL